jgi:hypothetical protein
MMSPPAALNHVGIAVPDISAAIDRYSQVAAAPGSWGLACLNP